MSKWKKKLGLEEVPGQGRWEKTLNIAVGLGVVIAGGVFIAVGDISYNPSDSMKNLVSQVTAGGEAAAATPYAPKDVDGVCTATFEGEMEHLSIQGNDEGYRWTAVADPALFTFEGEYVDEEGNIQPCDYDFYQEQFENREPQEALAQVNLVPEGGELYDGTLWGEDRGELVTSLHRFSGVAVRTPELGEGTNLGNGVTLIALAYNFECDDNDNPCIRWQAHIVASHDKEVILPSEERPLA